MGLKHEVVLEKISRLWSRLHGVSGIQQAGEEQPLRSKLFSTEQMTQHGKILAKSHRLKAGRSMDRLLARLTENETLLFEVHTLLTKDVKTGRRISPAGEWLLDNFYVIEEQIRTAPSSPSKGIQPRIAVPGKWPFGRAPKGIRPGPREYFAQ